MEVRGRSWKVMEGSGNPYANVRCVYNGWRESGVWVMSYGWGCVAPGSYCKTQSNLTILTWTRLDWKVTKDFRIDARLPFQVRKVIGGAVVVVVAPKLNSLPERTKMTQWWTKMISDWQKMTPGCPKMTPGWPNVTSGWPKMKKGSPKETPRWPQDDQERSKEGQTK